MATGEVAEAFGVSRQTVVRWAKEGVLPKIVLPSGRFRFRREDVEALIKLGEIA